MTERIVDVRISVTETNGLEDQRFQAYACIPYKPEFKVSGNGATPSEAAASVVRDLFFGWNMKGPPGMDCW